MGGIGALVAVLLALPGGEATPDGYALRDRQVTSVLSPGVPMGTESSGDEASSLSFTIEPFPRFPAYLQETIPAPEAAESPESPPGRVRRPVYRQVSITMGLVSAPDTRGYLAGLEAEFGFGNGLSISPSLAYYGYDWEDDDEEERGYGAGIGINLRWYVSRAVFKEFYVGMALSIFFIARWDWEKDEGFGFPPVDNEKDGDQVAGEHHWTFGYSFPMGDHTSLSTETFLGGYMTAAKSGSTLFGGLGLRLSYSF